MTESEFSLKRFTFLVSWNGGEATWTNGQVSSRWLIKVSQIKLKSMYNQKILEAMNARIFPQNDQIFSSGNTLFFLQTWYIQPVHLPECSTKLDAKTKKCIFTKYSSKSKSYTLLYDLQWEMDYIHLSPHLCFENKTLKLSLQLILLL